MSDTQATTPATVHLADGKQVEIASLEEFLNEMEHERSSAKLKDIRGQIAHWESVLQREDQWVTVRTVDGGEMRFRHSAVVGYE